MASDTTKPRRYTSWWAVILIVISLASIAGYALYASRGLTLMYDSIDQLTLATAERQHIVATIDGDSPPVHIVSHSVLTSTGLWFYTDRDHQLPATYLPDDLVALTLPFSSTDSEPKISSRIANPLAELFREAKSDGYDLIISSAYRSVATQQTMYDDFVAKKGKQLADQYVAPAGSSEHHTGLVIDINDDTPLCRSAPEKCSLSYDSALWLADHAPAHGFIIRYPSGAQPITGIAYEPWHLRYVGVVLAQQLTKADLTFDEFIEQIAPGRAQ